MSFIILIIINILISIVISTTVSVVIATSAARETDKLFVKATEDIKQSVIEILRDWVSNRK